MYETIEDVLVTLHTGQWFGFDGDKVYANLWVADGYDKPTEEELNTLLSTKQAEFDSKKEELQVQQDRAFAYPSIPDQLDDIFHNGLDGWKATIQTTKDKYPKG